MKTKNKDRVHFCISCGCWEHKQKWYNKNMRKAKTYRVKHNKRDIYVGSVTRGLQWVHRAFVVNYKHRNGVIIAYKSTQYIYTYISIHIYTLNSKLIRKNQRWTQLC